MKVVSSIINRKKGGKYCQIVRRRGLYIITVSDLRIKIRQGQAKMKYN